MDNFNLDITSEGSTHLVLAMKLAMEGKHFTRKITHYAVRPPVSEENDTCYPKRDRPLRLVFFWSEVSGASKLPFTISAAEDAAMFADRWLREAEYDEEPDHDGDNGKGWRVYNEAWGHVDGQWQAFVAISPEWAMYGK